VHTPGSQGNALGQRSAYPHRVVIETIIKISEMLLKGENRSQKKADILFISRLLQYSTTIEFNKNLNGS